MMRLNDINLPVLHQQELGWPGMRQAAIRRRSPGSTVYGLCSWRRHPASMIRTGELIGHKEVQWQQESLLSQSNKGNKTIVLVQMKGLGRHLPDHSRCSLCLPSYIKAGHIDNSRAVPSPNVKHYRNPTTRHPSEMPSRNATLADRSIIVGWNVVSLLAGDWFALSLHGQYDRDHLHKCHACIVTAGIDRRNNLAFFTRRKNLEGKKTAKLKGSLLGRVDYPRIAWHEEFHDKSRWLSPNDCGGKYYPLARDEIEQKLRGMLSPQKTDDEFFSQPMAYRFADPEPPRIRKRKWSRRYRLDLEPKRKRRRR